MNINIKHLNLFNKSIRLFIVFGLSILLIGCTGNPYRDRQIYGTAGGAAVGGLVGNAITGDSTGAIVGGAIGAGVGSAVTSKHH